MAVLATQKVVQERLKQWLEATEMKKAVEAATAAALEFDELYEESAVNLLARTPDLMLLLSAFVAGKEVGQKEGRTVATEQGLLVDG